MKRPRFWLPRFPFLGIAIVFVRGGGYFNIVAAVLVAATYLWMANRVREGVEKAWRGLNVVHRPAGEMGQSNTGRERGGGGQSLTCGWRTGSGKAAWRGRDMVCRLAREMGKSNTGREQGGGSTIFLMAVECVADAGDGLHIGCDMWCLGTCTREAAGARGRRASVADPVRAQRTLQCRHGVGTENERTRQGPIFPPPTRCRFFPQARRREDLMAVDNI
ncbi:hypothetical protein B0H16DRAFT_1474091 [Mycena metata]|uniref:Uncharacterized protein n=1 Tax=Mycena metata TaxID=1033252 RepID=A0AAD7MKI6_9AGAR|nr:hypothetical protein B0H16DRAFT_1474091 [Mycena metata]